MGPVWSLVWRLQERYMAERGTQLPPRPLTGLPAVGLNYCSLPVPKCHCHQVITQPRNLLLSHCGGPRPTL